MSLGPEVTVTVLQASSFMDEPLGRAEAQARHALARGWVKHPKLISVKRVTAFGFKNAMSSIFRDAGNFAVTDPSQRFDESFWSNAEHSERKIE